MSLHTTRHSRPPTIVAGGIIVALCALSNLATVATPVPLPVIVFGVVLAAAGAAAVVGIWMQKNWGRWLGAITLAATILLAAPGLTSPPSPGIAVLAVATIVIAAAGLILLLRPGSAVRQSAS